MTIIMIKDLKFWVYLRTVKKGKDAWLKAIEVVASLGLLPILSFSQNMEKKQPVPASAFLWNSKI